MTINELIETSHSNSKAKGFWDKYDYIINTLTNHKEFYRNDLDYTKQLFITQKLMLIVSELSESLEALRVNKICDTTDDILALEDEEFINTFKEKVKDTFEDEIADVFIRLGDMCGHMNIDIEKHILLKQKFNSTRDKLHGKNF